MNLFLAVLFAWLAAAHAAAQPANYRIEPTGSNRISLEVTKTGLLRGKKHQMEFPRYQGNLTLDLQNPATARVELVIDAASVTVNDPWLKPSDQKKVLDYTLNEMLAVKQYPEIRFLSVKVTPKSGRQFTVEGILTIRGIGKPVILAVTLDPAGPNIQGEGIIKLTDYGLRPPSAALGAIGTRDEMSVSFQVAAVK